MTTIRFYKQVSLLPPQAQENFYKKLSIYFSLFSAVFLALMLGLLCLEVNFPSDLGSALRTMATSLLAICLSNFLVRQGCPLFYRLKDQCLIHVLYIFLQSFFFGKLFIGLSALCTIPLGLFCFLYTVTIAAYLTIRARRISRDAILKRFDRAQVVSASLFMFASCLSIRSLKNI